MTYVLGVRRLGIAAIITDSQISTLRGAAPPGTAAIKSGVLFPGCIYGISGNWDRAWDCIEAARKVCCQSTLAERFDRLAKFIYYYHFSPGPYNAFEILISSRHAGTPDFYLISSSTEHMHPINGDLMTLGSGMAFLNQMILPYSETLGSEERIRKSHEGARALGLPVLDEDFAYDYAFFVHQRTFGDDGMRLARDGVGGLVHFILQDASHEWRQKPSLYVLSHRNEANNDGEWFSQRIAFDSDPEFGDVILCARAGSGIDKPQWLIQFQNNTGSDKTIPDFKGRFLPFVERHQKEPLYHFFLAGGVDWTRHGKVADDYVVFADVWQGFPAMDLDGKITRPLLEWLMKNT